MLNANADLKRRLKIAVDAKPIITRQKLKNPTLKNERRNAMSSFFMVYVEGNNAPVVRYSVIILAEAEAKRLAKLTGKKAFVLASIKSIEVNEFKIEDCRPNDDLPF